MQTVHVTQDFPQPIEELFDHLSEQENLEPLFGAEVKRVADGSGGRRDGGGASRALLGAPGRAFVETNVAVRPNELVRSRITKGGVLKDNEGVMRFSRHGDGSHLDYTITFDGKVPGLGPLVQKMLTRAITKGLKDYAAKGSKTAAAA